MSSDSAPKRAASNKRPVPQSYQLACEAINAKKKECQSQLKKVRNEMKQDTVCSVVLLNLPQYQHVDRQEQRKLGRLRKKASRLSVSELHNIALLKGISGLGKAGEERRSEHPDAASSKAAPAKMQEVASSAAKVDAEAVTPGMEEEELMDQGEEQELEENAVEKHHGGA